MCWTVQRQSEQASVHIKLLERTLEFIVFFPDLVERWVIRNKMMLKAALRQQLEDMRKALESSLGCGSDRVDTLCGA
jgi:hypothetical protein